MINQIIKREHRVRTISVLLMVISFLVVLSLNKEILISFLLASVYAYLLGPVVTYMERFGLSRSFAILIPYFVILGVFILIITIFSPIIVQQLASLQTNFPDYMDGIRGLLARWEGGLNKLFFNLYTVDISTKLEKHIESGVAASVAAIPSIVSTTLTTSLLAPILAFFLLLDGRTMMKKLLSFVPNTLFELSLNLTHQINEQFGEFIRAKILESIIVGLATWIGLYLINFPYSIFLALFAAVTNLIPYVGPIVGAVPAFILAAINPELNSLIVFVAVVYLTAQLIDIVFLIPVVVARTVNLHPVTVLLAIILGAKVMGVLGMLIAIPVASIIKLTFSTLYNHLVHFRT